MPGEGRDKVVVDNRADGGIAYWVGKLFGFAALMGMAIVMMTAVCTYGHYARVAPPVPDLATYAREVPAVSRMYAADGTLLGEFATEWRELVPYEDIPRGLVDAFVAIEDHEFFEHRGIYFRGIARAVWRNFVAGDFAQGGSTITQQVAKSFLGNEKSLSRKAIEAIVARRLEARYSKRAILSLYMNQIYLGNGAYGVRAAARRYFSKHLDELTVAEMAMLAGLAQRPSDYSPTHNPDGAIARRNVVLDKMQQHGFLTAEAADAARAEPLRLVPYGEQFGEVSPYFAEHVRRYVVERYGDDALLEDGLRIETTIDLPAEAAAYSTVVYGARKQDKRQGWRGSEAFLDGSSRDLFIERAEALYGDAPPAPGHRYLGLVEKVEARRALVRVGKVSYEMPLKHMKWASQWETQEALNDIEILSAKEALREGDVVWVSRVTEARGEYREWYLAGMNPRWAIPREERAPKNGDPPPVLLQLEQDPHPQAALLVVDHGTGYIVSMVGGSDYTRSEYNRAIQACRQPASTYKPIYYSAAIDMGYGYDSLFNDMPRAEVDPVTGEVWTPQNLYGLHTNKVTMEYALVFSKNVPSVAIFSKVGAKNVEAWARRLGFTTKIIADKALALGASCTTLDELTRAFAIFARNGKWLDLHGVRRIADRAGNIIEDNTVAYDPMLRGAERLDRVAATAGIAPAQAIPERTAFLTSKLLRRAIKFGFANIVRQTGVNAAGKTGTSSETMDTTFVGYTSRWIATVWMGDDQRKRPLGVNDAAYMTVVPMWARFMAEAAEGHPNDEIPWEIPRGTNKDDRGGDRGEQALEPMELKWHKKPKPEEQAEG